MLTARDVTFFLFHLSYNVLRYILKSIIRSFGDKQTKKLFEREPSRRIPENIQRMAFRKLRMLHRATTLDDLRIPPGNHLEALEVIEKANIASYQ